MSLPKKLSATKAMLALLLWCSCTLALAAQVAGTVVQLSGPLLARKASGAVKILSLKSEVESGDTLVTEKNTYAMVRFIDNSEMTLKPATTMKIDSYAFDNAKPDGDAANFSLVKGGLRSVTGLLGKRNKEKFELKTPSATIGIRGTTFLAEYVPPDEERALASLQAWLNASTAALGDSVMPVAPLQLAQGPLVLPTPGTQRAPGLYVQVLDGLIHVTNPAGTANFSAGQFGYTPNFKQPPVILPVNPGIPFTPPPAFNSSTPTSSTGPQGKSNTIDCEVR
ncbi:FecR family protein [Pseudoduganella aquatica]|uniref:FecR family protein n=1 Tax=Pseudoduganella aquatica TaxID=2660641 RepID=UPI001E554A00|nr:FecR family protein [Pseudoduganella aquatica]